MIRLGPNTNSKQNKINKLLGCTDMVEWKTAIFELISNSRKKVTCIFFFFKLCR